ncbi:MAG: DNA repair protein RecO [Oscillospiraceae bacterium]|jgi:DNA repair protein RecO (recombination protein O)|nr:DNA repair protein RecO [Oscillospiraceae bacterium]
MHLKTQAIVLRETQYNDNDKLLTILTRHYGKMTVKARGVKSRASKLKASCQLLAFSEFTLLEHRDRYIITEADTIAMFSELRSDLELLSLASYFSQVTELLSQEDDPDPALLSLLLCALHALCRNKQPQSLIKAGFELRLACLAGYLPDLRGCAVCGKRDADRFNITRGALECASCAAEQGIRLPLSAGTLEAMRYVCAAPIEKLFSFRLSAASLAELSGIAEAYLCTRLERGFYTLDFYKSLFITEKQE